MPYWGVRAGESDYSAGVIGSFIYIIKERMLKDLETVTTKGFPEQSVVACITCLRLLGERFPQDLSVHFGKNDLEQVRIGFYKWYELVQKKLPKEIRAGLREEAEVEFTLFEKLIS